MNLMFEIAGGIVIGGLILYKLVLPKSEFTNDENDSSGWVSIGIGSLVAWLTNEILLGAIVGFALYTVITFWKVFKD